MCAHWILRKHRLKILLLSGKTWVHVDRSWLSCLKIHSAGIRPVVCSEGQQVRLRLFTCFFLVIGQDLTNQITVSPAYCNHDAIRVVLVVLGVGR